MTYRMAQRQRSAPDGNAEVIESPAGADGGILDVLRTPDRLHTSLHNKHGRRTHFWRRTAIQTAQPADLNVLKFKDIHLLNFRMAR